MAQFCDSLENTLITQSLVYICECSVMGTPLRQATGRYAQLKKLYGKMGILDLLFGKKIIKQDDFFGQMESDRTRKKDETKSITWGFNKKIGLFKKETYIILEGNYNNVNPTQKSQLKGFIENFDSIYSLDVDKLIDSNNKFMKFKDWRNDYFIAFICPLMGSNTNFEVNFEAMNEENNENHFSFELINGVVKNIAIH